MIHHSYKLMVGDHHETCHTSIMMPFAAKLLRQLTAMFVLCFWTVSLTACHDADETLIISHFHQNNPLCDGQKRLRVLAIGNSYSKDGVAQLQGVLNAAGLDTTTYTVYVAAHDAATLKHWWEMATTDSIVALNHYAGYHIPDTVGTLGSMLSYPWDVIVLQQYSGQAINYSTYNPSLNQLINFIVDNSTNPQLSLAWQLIWSYADVFSDTQPTGLERWRLICAATKQMMTYDGIDIIIPSGTAIQLARATSLNTDLQLTRDGTHLDVYAGRYIAACTWAQALFAPVYGFDIGDLSTTSWRYDAQLCRQCAIKAVLMPFNK